MTQSRESFVSESDGGPVPTDWLAGRWEGGGRASQALPGSAWRNTGHGPHKSRPHKGSSRASVTPVTPGRFLPAFQGLAVFAYDLDLRNQFVFFCVRCRELTRYKVVAVRVGRSPPFLPTLRKVSTLEITLVTLFRE